MVVLRSRRQGCLSNYIPRLRGHNLVRLFPQVDKITSIRFILFVATTFDLNIDHIDFKTTFLQGDLEVIYKKKLEHFIEEGKESLICKLKKKKSLYDLK